MGEPPWKPPHLNPPSPVPRSATTLVSFALQEISLLLNFVQMEASSMNWVYVGLSGCVSRSVRRAAGSCTAVQQTTACSSGPRSSRCSSLGVIMKNILCRFYYGWIFLFHLGKNIFLPVFRIRSTTSYSHQQHIKIPVAPQSCQLLVLTVFSILAILKLVK